MPATLIDGKQIASDIQQELAREVRQLSQRHKITPSLVSVVVGSHHASEMYLRNQERVAQEIGIQYRWERFEESIAEERLIEKIRTFGDDPSVSGIIVHQPLPSPFNKNRVISAVRSTKDAEGIHPYNLGRVALDEAQVVPCTALAVLEIIKRIRFPLEGKEAVIIGASDIIGKPLSLSLMNRAATVAICHIATRDVASHTRRADLLVVAAGKPGLVTRDMVKAGAVVIDVGINRVGGKTVGDVAPDVVDTASYLSPVPGGVGPLTVTMLMKNVVEAFKRERE